MNEPDEPASAGDGLRSLVFEEDYRLTIVLEPDGRLRDIVDSDGVTGVDLFSLGDATIVETSRRSVGGERRAEEWEQRLRDLNEHRRPIRYRATPPGASAGQPESVECVATPIPAADGSLDCILLVAQDHSSQMRVEAQLRESEERFTQLAEALPQMAWVAVPTGAVVYFSPQWESFTGRSQEDLLGAGFRDLIHPDDLELIEPGSVDEVEFKAVRFRMRNATGEFRWMESDYRTVLDDDGQVLRWVGGTTDVTERRAAEDEAREQQEQLRVALAVTGMGRYALYFRENRLTGDSRLSAILGIDIDAVMREHGLDGIFARLHEDDVEHVRKSIEIAAGRGPDYDVEYRMWRPVDRSTGPDELHWVAARGRVEFDAEGPVRMVGVIEDITQRKLEEEARLRWQKREEIGSLAGGIAHDFNNVISAILSNATLAETELRFGVSPATSITEIARGAERAADIVKRLLAVSREDEPVRGPFDLCEVAQEACALLSSSLHGKITLRCDTARGLPTVIGSSTELHQVVVNLVANASHAVDGRGGRIDVIVDEVDAQTSEGAPKAKAVRLRVRDTGTGIPDSVLGRVFDPFFTTKPAGKGTGLGLAAARTIVRNHGGSITAENAEGGGALFTVLLPAAENADNLAIPRRAAAPGLTVGALDTSGAASAPETDRVIGRVFFVDDEAALVRLAERALPIRGYAVRAFTDPHEALSALTAAPHGVDALVTDLSMPGLSGLELIERVRVLRPDLPVILSSGFLTAANREQADRHGVDVIVPKPCSVDDLAAALIGLLDRDGATRSDRGDGADSAGVQDEHPGE